MSLPRFRLVQGKAIGERSTPTNPAGFNTSESAPQPPQQLQTVPKQEPLDMSGYPSIDAHQMKREPSPIVNIKIEDPTSPPQMMGGTPQPPHQMQQRPQHPMQQQQIPQMQQAIPSQMQYQMGAGSVTSEDKNVIKCVRFLKTLINLSNNDDPEQPDKAVRVKQLIQGVIYMETTAEDFTRNLQQVLKSQAQPHLLPFLQNTLPALRDAVRKGEASVEGVAPPPGYVFNNGRAPMPPTSHPSQQHPSQQIISRLNAEPQLPPRGMMQQRIPPQQIPMNQRPSIPGPLQMQQIPMHMHQQMPLQQQHPQQQHPQQQHPQQQNSQQQHPQQQHPQQHPQPPHQPHPQQTSQMPPQQPPQQQHLQMPLQGPPSHQNDSKMEVDETPQTRQYSEGSLKSSILRPEEILNRITKRMMSSCSVEEEALVAIADACESQLREILVQMAGIAEHRVESMRVPENYVAVDDVKRQLRFLEDVDRQEEELRESREKESLIRMSKNKNSGKETIEKAKEMQRQDAEAKRNRDANAAAIAALSSNRTVKNKWEGAAPSTSAPRPRTVRITTRDAHLLINNDHRFNGTFLREKLSYGGPATDTTI